MDVAEIQAFGWQLAFVTIGLTVSWVVLVLQAFFSDKRIAFVGVIGGALAALSMAFSAALSHFVLAAAALMCLLFLLIFVVKNIKNPIICSCAAVFLISVGAAAWLNHLFQNMA